MNTQARREAIVIVVHGEKQDPDGSIHPEYVDRLALAAREFRARYYRPGIRPILLLTGGKTRAGEPAEAEQAKKWALIEGIPEEDILIETGSRTSAENILFAQDLLRQKGVVPLGVIAIVRASALPKTRYLYGRFWTLGTLRVGERIAFVKGKDMKSIAYKIADMTVLYLVAVIDPYDKWVLSIPKLLFRNSGGAA